MKKVIEQSDNIKDLLRKSIILRNSQLQKIQDQFVKGKNVFI